MKRTSAAEFDDIPGELPKSTVPENADSANVAQIAIDLCNNFQQAGLADNIIWRDFLAFTDTYRTFHTVDTVFTTFQKLSQARRRSSITLGGEGPRLVQNVNSSWFDVDVEFSLYDGNLVGKCGGTVSVSMDSASQWKIWMIRTWLEHYEGHGDPDHLEPAGENNRAGSYSDLPSNGNRAQVYDVIIVGGGQGGLGLAGRLQALGVSYIVFDNRPNIGDSWAHRYDSLRWHTIKEYGNLPFGRTFAQEDENLLPAKRIAARYRSWSEKYGINAQSATNVDTATWDENLRTWTVQTSGAMGTEQWVSTNLVLCVGIVSKTPVSPDWASPEKIKDSEFKGTILHSADYRNANMFAGQRGVVIGTANTAHDIAEDMWVLNGAMLSKTYADLSTFRNLRANLGMHTTMIQRNPTFILPGEWVVAFQSHDYHLDKPTDIADRELVTVPFKIQREMANRMLWGLIKAHPERFDALEKAGFKVDRYGDLLSSILIRFGGHYVDIGSCERIAKGEIKVKAQLVERLTKDGLMFQDGSELKADLIVLCTGFDHDFRKDAAGIIGRDVAEQMDDFWGVDAEGELRGYGKMAGHPHLYYAGGEARLSRFFTRFVALQIQKEKLGQPLRPYMRDM